MSSVPAISVSGVSYGYVREHLALAEVSFEIAPGEIFVFLGLRLVPLPHGSLHRWLHRLHALGLLPMRSRLILLFFRRRFVPLGRHVSRITPGSFGGARAACDRDGRRR